MKGHLSILLALASTSLGDTLMPLGDEFDDAATMARWQDIDEVEGWVLSSDEAADINTTTPGHFRIVPRAMGWYMNLRGVLFFKNVTGDFIATTKLRVLSRHNPINPSETPNRLFSLTGIFLHEPRPYITHAAPNPYRTDAVWPPAAFGSDYVANTENYIFLSYGTAGNAGTRQFEIKTTRNSNSVLYFNSTGVPQQTNEAWMQLVRVGNTVVCLRKYAEAGQWIVENRYPNPDHQFPAFGSTLQVGITAYTDWPNGEPYHNGGVQSSYWVNYAAPTPGTPDLISEVDYFRLQRPPGALTEAMLQGMATSYNPEGNFTANPPTLLSASPAASAFLGENANIPLGRVAFAAAQFAGREGGTISVNVTRSGASLNRPLSLTYQTLLGTASSDDVPSQSGTLSWAANDPATKTILIPTTADQRVESHESFELRLNELDGPATFPASAPSLSVPILIEEHPFNVWRVAQFGAAANEASAAVDADADQDGVSTLFEDVFQTNPLLAEENSALPTSVAAGGSLGIRFRSPATPGVRLEVQYATTLGSWQTVASRSAGTSIWQSHFPNFSITTDPARPDGVQITTSASDQRGYMRLMAIVESL